MLQHGSILLQTNFNTLNPKIPALEPDKMIIPRNTTNWTAQFKAACINNYGAAGSNATMIVTQAPSAKLESHHVTLPKRQLRKFPVYVSANTKGALDAYCKALMVTISRLPSSTNNKDALASLAFNLNIKQNRTLTYFISRTVDDMAALERILQSVDE
jgi:acyl transferase domain-containing protein